jgi:hypothetical protein
MTVDSAWRKLRAADPSLGAAVDDRAEQDLRRILDTTPHDVGVADRHRSSRRLAVAAAAAIVLAAVVLNGGVAGIDGSPAYAATPSPLTILSAPGTGGVPTDAVAALDAIAASALEQSDRSGTGRYARVHTESWAIWTRIDGDRATSEVVPQETVSWTAADGSGRIRVNGGASGSDRSTDRLLRPGERALMWPLRSLSSDIAVLEEQFLQGHPEANGPAERLVALADAVAEQPLTPAVRAASVRYLARTDGLLLDGLVSDRAGRRGLAFHVETSMSGLPERRSVIIDPDDGRLLAVETALIGSAGGLNVAPGSVISYTTFRSAVFTDSLD